MTTKRRQFLKTFASLSGGLIASPWLNPLRAESRDAILAYQNHTAEELVDNEDFWGLVRQAYNSSPNIINFNSGGVSPHPKQVREAVDNYTRHANEAPALYMWREMERSRRHTLQKLSKLTGTSKEEIALQRNTTEAINVILQGIDWESGDEVVTSSQDYPAMINALNQLVQRYKIKVTQVKLPVPALDQESLLRPFEAAISKKTRLVLVSHMINLSGQIMPVKAISEIAHEHGAEVLVDGAHSFAHLDFKIPDLGADYFATSLHKWLCAPFGTGLLYIKKEKIPHIWPLFAAPEGQVDKMTKFEHQGTRSVPAEIAISHAVDFHSWVGIARKQARLHYLKSYWTEKVKELPRLSFNTNLAPEHSCAIANFSISGEDMRKLGSTFLSKHNLYTTLTHHEDVKGMRIYPNVFTSLEELDHLVEAIGKSVKG